MRSTLTVFPLWNVLSFATVLAYIVMGMNRKAATLVFTLWVQMNVGEAYLHLQASGLRGKEHAATGSPVGKVDDDVSCIRDTVMEMNVNVSPMTIL